MIKVLMLLVLICLLAYAQTTDTNQPYECNPIGENVPDCANVESSDQRFRNNWDPTVYFICKNFEAVEVSCNGKGYDPFTQQCVPWSEWVWSAPCSSIATTKASNPTTAVTATITTTKSTAEPTTEAPVESTIEEATETITEAPVESTTDEATDSPLGEATTENVTEENTFQTDTCDPDAEGTPDCKNIISSNERYRNNWDSTKYFTCANGQAVELSCNDQGYDPTTQQCVPWSEWIWTAPCSSADGITKTPEETTTSDIPKSTTLSDGCDPNAEGTPDCKNIISSNERYRNNWDSTKYFACANGQAVELSCNDQGYDPTTQQCVPWSEWIWTAPCSAADGITKTPEETTTSDIPISTMLSDGCDPYAEGTPDCSNIASNNERYPNNWDSTKYFACANGRVVELSCNDQGYDSTTQQCVPWSEWTWTAPCSD